MSKFTLTAFADEIAPDLRTQLDYLKKFNIGYIDLRKVDERDVFKLQLSEAKEIRRQLVAAGIGVSSIGSSIGKIWITDDFEPHLEWFRNTIDIAHMMEARYIRMFSFRIPAGEDPARYRDKVMDNWRLFVEAAAGSGLVLLHENERGMYGNTPERCRELLDTMNCSDVKAAFDPANFLTCGEEAYPKSFDMLKDHIAYVHIKDGRLYQRGALPAGEGEGKIHDMLKALHDRGYEGFLSLEPHLHRYDVRAALEQDPGLAEWPEGGPRTFAIAYRALDRIVEKIVG